MEPVTAECEHCGETLYPDAAQQAGRSAMLCGACNKHTTLKPVGVPDGLEADSSE